MTISTQISSLELTQPRSLGYLGVVLATVLMATACQTTATPPTQAAQPEASKLGAEARTRITELAEQALADERYHDAQKLIERVLVHEPNDPRARLVNAELLLANGRNDDAMRDFRSLSEAGPEVQAKAMQGYGITLMLAGKPNEAAAMIQQAVAVDETLWRAWNVLGYYHDQRTEWAAAEDAYQHAIEARPDAALLYNNRGYSRLMQRRPKEAMQDFAQALRLNPKLQIAETNMRLALAWEGNYRRALSGVPRVELASALNNVGYVALLRGDLTEAEGYLARAMEQDAGYNAQASRNLDYLKSVRDDDKGPLGGK